MRDLQYSVALNNLALDTKINAIGHPATLKIFSGGRPLNCAAPDPEGLLCLIELPDWWMERAQDGAAKSTGAWRAIVSANGRAISFRIYSADGECHLQGSIGKSGGPGHMLLKQIDLEVGQVLIIDTFTLASGNR
jgi:hypothetical protein